MFAFSGQQEFGLSARHNVPVILGYATATNISGSAITDHHIPIPARARPGLRLLTISTRGADTPYDPIVGGQRLGYVQRAGTALGINYTTSIQEKILDDTEVAQGYVLLPTLGDNQAAISCLLWCDYTLVFSLSPMSSAATATAGFNRAGTTDQISVPAVELTPTKDALAISVVAWQGGLRTVTQPATYTQRQEAMPASTANSRNCLCLASKIAPKDVGTGTATWDFSGAATLRPMSFTLLAYTR